MFFFFFLTLVDPLGVAGLFSDVLREDNFQIIKNGVFVILKVLPLYLSKEYVYRDVMAALS